MNSCSVNLTHQSASLRWYDIIRMYPGSEAKHPPSGGLSAWPLRHCNWLPAGIAVPCSFPAGQCRQKNLFPDRPCHHRETDNRRIWRIWKVLDKVWCDHQNRNTLFARRSPWMINRKQNKPAPSHHPPDQRLSAAKLLFILFVCPDCWRFRHPSVRHKARHFVWRVTILFAH